MLFHLELIKKNTFFLRNFNLIEKKTLEIYFFNFFKMILNEKLLSNSFLKNI